MSIQTVIVEHRYDNELVDDHKIFFLEESPDEVKASIESRFYDGIKLSITRTVYSLEEYMKEQTRPLSDFCPPAAKKGIWWLAVSKDAISELLIQRTITNHQVWSYIDHYHNHVEHHHVTLAYNVTKDDKPVYRLSSGNSYELDKHPPIVVKGLAYNDKAACLVVDVKPMESCNRRPHITLATAEGIAPVYTNDMLAGKDGAYHFLPLEAELEDTLEFFEFS